MSFLEELVTTLRAEPCIGIYLGYERFVLSNFSVLLALDLAGLSVLLLST